jgi:hypothetical protein
MQGETRPCIRGVRITTLLGDIGRGWLLNPMLMAFVVKPLSLKRGRRGKTPDGR